MKIKYFQNSLRLISIIILLQLCFSSIVAQLPEITKQRILRYSNSNDALRVIKITPDMGFIAGVSSNSSAGFDKSQPSKGGNDFWVYKASRNGMLQWEKTIGGSLNDNIKSLVVTSDGGYLLAGESASPVSGDKTEASINSDIWIVKLDANGNIVWQNTIQGAAQDSVASVIEAKDGGYYILGTSTSGIGYDKTSVNYGSTDLWLIKVNSSGNVVWDKGFGGTGADVVLYPDLIEYFDNGDLLLGASSTSGVSGNKTVGNLGSYDFWLLRCDTSGSVKWQKSIGGNSDDQLTDVQKVKGNGFLLSSSSASELSVNKSQNYFGYPSPMQKYDYWVMKIDTSGSIIWEKTIGGILNDQIGGAASTDSGFYYLSGISFSPASGIKTSPQLGGGDFWLVVLDTSGNIVTQNSWGSSGREIYAWIDYRDGKCIMAERADLVGSGNILELPRPKGNWNSWIVTLNDRAVKHNIHGRIFADLNNNCVKDTGEPNLFSTFITNALDEVTSYAMDGIYTLPISDDIATLYISNLDSLYKIGCRPGDSINISFSPTSSIDTFNIDFPIQPVLRCINTQITSYGASFPRICDTIEYSVHYYNNSFDTAYNAFLVIRTDTTILKNFHSPHLFSFKNDSLQFNLGNLAPFERRTIKYYAQISCSTYLGTGICQQAWIYPLSNCSRTSDYDSSQVNVNTSCQGDTVEITLQNNSSFNMDSTGILKYYNQEDLLDQVNFRLNAFEQISRKYYAVPNSTLSFVVSQNPYHPAQPFIIQHDDRCALISNPKLNTVLLRFPRYDESYNYEEICQIVRGSYDPNIKTVVPEGFTENNFIEPNQRLKYRIDFQNTGTDTAFRVEVIDTISPLLNIETFVPGASSTTYTVSLEDNRILHFLFYPIALPDSGASQINSRGYVSFTIDPKPGLTHRTKIENFVDIYFDLNDPVRTNKATNTIYDTVSITIGFDQSIFDTNTEAIVFPNPSDRMFVVKLSQKVQNADLSLINLEGKTLLVDQILDSDIKMINTSALPAGTYILKGTSDGKNIFSKKVILY